MVDPSTSPLVPLSSSYQSLHIKVSCVKAKLMEIMVVKQVVEVEVGADVAAAGAGEGRK